MAAMEKNNKNLNVPNLRFPEFSGEWEKCSLGEIGHTSIGLTYSPADVVKEDGITVLRSSNIQDGEIDYKDLVRVNKKIKDSLFTKKDDILICARNGSQRLIGKNALISDVDAGHSYGAFMMVYRSEENPFVRQLLCTKRYFAQVGENLGARINQITTSDMNSFEFFFPQSKEERNKIALFLRIIDERISTQKKIIEDLKKLKDAINNSLYNNINEFQLFSFNELGNDYSGLTGKSSDDFGSGLPYINYLNVLRNGIVTDGPFDCVKVSKTEKQNIVSYGDLLFTLSSETPSEVGIGAIYLGKTNPLYLNSFCFGVHLSNQENIYGPYLAYFVTSQYFRRTILPFAQGSTRYNLMKSDFMKHKFCFPNMASQKAIYNALHALSEKIQNEEVCLNKYTEQKQYLLTRLFI